MGASTFIDITVGSDANDAFARVVEQAQWEHGHGGYSGTIAEKGSFRAFTLPEVPGLTPSEVVDLCISGNDEDTEYTRHGGGTYENGKWVREPSVTIPIPPPAQKEIARIREAVDDKWGEAGCFDISGTPEGQGFLGRWLEQEQRSGMFNVNERTGARTRVGPEPTTAGQRVFIFFGWASS